MNDIAQNTEFPLPEDSVKADIEFVVLERCAEGLAILIQWGRDIKAEPDFDKAWAIFNKGAKYNAHLKTCDQCRTYLIAKHANMADLPEEKK